MFVEQVRRADWVDYALLEMTIIPIPKHWKRPDYRWTRLKWTRLHVLMDTASGQRTLSKLFELGGDGLAVVCGSPSENLFVIDCDTMDSLNELRRQLWANGIDAPCVYTARGGHLYLRCREGAVRTVSAGVMQDVEIRGAGAIAVLPPSQHASGINYRWADGHPPRHIPTVSKDDIDFLTGVDGRAIKLKVAAKSVRRLCDDTRDYLAHGHRLAEGSRNARLFNAARDYRYVDKNSSDALHDLLPIALKSGLSEKEATDTILSPFKSAPRRKQTFNQTDELTAFMLGIPWLGRTRQTDKRLFEALIERRAVDAHGRKDGAFRASRRELATVMRMSTGAVGRGLKRLIDAKYIEFVGRDKDSTANLYRMSDMVLGAGQFFLLHNRHIKQQVSSRSDYCVHFAQLSESSAFGIVGTNILQYLRNRNQLMTAAAITDGVGCHRSTTIRNLSKLMDAGLVERIGNHYRAAEVSVAEERALVVNSGAYADDIARRARFDRERAAFALNPILEFLWKRNQEGKS